MRRPAGVGCRRVPRWRLRAALAVLVLLSIAVAVPVRAGVFSSTTTNGASQFTAAATFPTYPASVTTSTPWAYHRSEDAMSSAATSTAADTSANSRPGTYGGSTNGPTLHWTFDEGSGTTTRDTSGAGNSGTVRSTATWSTGLGGSGAITNDGTNMAGNSPTTQPIRADQSFTVSLWVYKTGTIVNNHVVAGMTRTLPTANPRSDWVLLFNPNSGNPRWTFMMAQDPTSTTNTTWDTLMGTSTAVTNRWTHLTVVFDTSVAGGTMYLYVNGVAEGSRTHTPLNNTTSGQQFDLGRWRNNSSTGANWYGSYDEVRTYRRALSGTEVSNLAKSLPEVKWDFSEASGTTTADSGANGNTGTLGSTATFVAGHVGKAVNLPNSANGYVQADAKAVNTDAAFSVSAWAYVTSTGVARAVATQTGTTSSAFILKFDSSGKWAFTLPRTDVTNPAFDQIVSTGAAATNSWVHLVGVYDDTAATIRLYVNATSQGTVAHAAASEWDATGPLQVGRSWWNGAWADPWSGMVDSVRVYQRALTQTEVNSLYADTDPTAPFPEAGFTAGLTGALQGAQQGQQNTTAVAFAGTSNAYNNLQVAAPGPTAFTIECWFRTTSTTGGALMGFAGTQTGTINSYDRVVYLDGGNRLTFGTWPTTASKTVRSPAGTVYNDGVWHHVAASLGAAGLKLHVDGALVASDATTTTAGNFAGYWRWGGNPIASTWPNQPADDYLTGALDEIAIYGSQLSDQQVTWHYYANH